MEQGRSFGDYLNALVGWLGPVGTIAAMFLVVAIVVTVLLWRHGAATLLWTYMLLVFISAGRAGLYRASVLPVKLISVCGALRWFVLIPLSLLGFGYLFRGKVKNDGTLWLLLVWGLIALISAIVGSQKWLAFERAFAMLLLIGVAFVAYRVVSAPNGLTNFMRTYFCLAVVCACIVLSAVALRPGLVFAGGRFRGFVNNANMMGWVSAAMLIPCAWAWLDTREFHPLRKTTGSLLTVLWSVCLVLTASRASVVASIPIFLSIILLKKTKPLFWIGVLILGVIVAFGAYLFMEAEGAAHLQNLNPSVRMAHARYGFSVATERPLLGHGYGYADLFVRMPWSGRGLHNGYMRLAIDLGLAGILVFAALSVLAVRNSRMVSKSWKSMGITPTAPTLLRAFIYMNLLNAVVEGWLTGIGSPQLFAYVVLIGACAGAYHKVLSELREQQQTEIESGEMFHLDGSPSMQI